MKTGAILSVPRLASEAVSCVIFGCSNAAIFVKTKVCGATVVAKGKAT